MLALDIQKNGNNVSVELPLPIDTLVGELRSIGIYEPLEKISRADCLLQPTNELGEHFMRLVRVDDSLQAIATASREFEVLDGDSRQALVDLLMTDRFYDLDHMADYLQYGPDAMPTETMRFLCPLKVSVEADGNPHLVEGDQSLLVWHEDEIRDALQDEVPDGKNMADYLPEALKPKIASVEWDVTRVQGKLYGSISCELCVPLSPDEQVELTGWITGQNSDGLCEGFEQHPVDTDDGELYVHFWHSGDDYFVMPAEEFFQRLQEQTLSAAAPQKPDCPLIGQDGNMFNLIGLAARTLRQHGLTDQAKEMSERAFASGSYDQALGVIAEYVNVTSPDEDMDEDEEEDEDWCREPEYDEDGGMLDSQGFGGMGGMA